MDSKEIVKKFLETNEEVAEVQLEYKDGSSADYSLEPEVTGVTRETALASLLDTVDWDSVEEVEAEFENGDKIEIDLDPDDDDDDDDNDDDDESTT